MTVQESFMKVRFHPPFTPSNKPTPFRCPVQDHSASPISGKPLSVLLVARLTNELCLQSDWTPPVTPALWGRMEDGDCHRSPHHEQSGQWSGDCKTEPCAPSCNQPPPQQQQQQQQPYHSPEGNFQPTHGQSQTSWFNIDDKRKKELEVRFLTRINYSHHHMRLFH
jgi:hypothetical protein